MVTKIALLPTGFGPTIGAIRAFELSDEDRNLLRKYYGLDPDANLATRNAVRGYLAGKAGGTAGAIVGAALGAALSKKMPFKAKKQIANLSEDTFQKIKGGLIGALIGNIIGNNAGGYFGTERYTKAEADRIRKLQKKTAATQEETDKLLDTAQKGIYAFAGGGLGIGALRSVTPYVKKFNETMSANMPEFIRIKDTYVRAGKSPLRVTKDIARKAGIRGRDVAWSTFKGGLGGALSGASTAALIAMPFLYKKLHSKEKPAQKNDR